MKSNISLIFFLIIFMIFSLSCTKSKDEQSRETDKEDVTGDEILQVNIKEITSSCKYLKEENELCKYHPYKAFDSDPETAWAEGSVGDGIYESISIFFKNEIKVDKITIMPGYFDERWHKQNNRIKNIWFYYGINNFDNKFEKKFEDEMTEQSIYSNSPISFNRIEIKISDVFPGTNFNDTCIAEIKFYINGKEIQMVIDPEEYMQTEKEYWALLNSYKGMSVPELNDALIDALYEENEPDIIKLKRIIEAGADVNYIDKSDEAYTPVIKMVIHKSLEPPIPELAELFLAEGADPNQLDYRGESALQYAVMCFDNEEIINLLLSYGAKVQGQFNGYSFESDGTVTETGNGFEYKEDTWILNYTLYGTWEREGSTIFITYIKMKGKEGIGEIIDWESQGPGGPSGSLPDIPVYEDYRDVEYSINIEKTISLTSSFVKQH